MVANARPAFHVLQLTLYEWISPHPYLRFIHDLFTKRSCSRGVPDDGRAVRQRLTSGACGTRLL